MSEECSNGDGQGDYFAKNGQYLGRDKWDDNKVFLADGIVNGHFHNIKRLDVSQHRFKVMANIIAQEGSSKDPEEYTFIANIARNEANAQGRSMWSLLTSVILLFLIRKQNFPIKIIVKRQIWQELL